jgi:hypothetical protein
VWKRSPGSHIWGDTFADGVQRATQPAAALAAVPQRPRATHIEEAFGVGGADLPSVALESQPGDACVFIQTCKHAAFGGGGRG